MRRLLPAPLNLPPFGQTTPGSCARARYSQPGAASPGGGGGNARLLAQLGGQRVRTSAAVGALRTLLLLERASGPHRPCRDAA